MPALLTCEDSDTVSDSSRAFLPVPLLENQMANTNQAVAPAQSAVGSATAEMFGSSEIETIEQLGRDYWAAEDAKAKAERTLGQCDVALFDIVRGVDYVHFMKVRELFVTGCRDKGSPTDEAAAKVWERAINRIKTSCNFERPKAESKDAKRMSEKAAKQAAELAALSDLELDAKRTELIERGDTKALREAATLSKELDRRAKPEIDKAKAEAKLLAETINKRVKELVGAATPDAIDTLIRMVQASK